MINLYNADCLEIMKEIPAESIDMILCDLPYGVTRCEWDKNIDLKKLWNEYERVIKENGVKTSSDKNKNIEQQYKLNFITSC